MTSTFGNLTSIPQRKSPIPFRVTDEERNTIETAATCAGLTTSAYIRCRVLDGAPAMRVTRKPPIERSQLVQLLGHTGRLIGVIQHMEKRPDIDISQIAYDLRTVVSAIMAALGRRPHDH